jgi:hypothetical protein
MVPQVASLLHAPDDGVVCYVLYTMTRTIHYIHTLYMVCITDIILTTDFAPKSTNPIAIKNVAKTLDFDLKIQNNAAAGSDISVVALYM